MVTDLPTDVKIVVGYASKIGGILLAGGVLALVATGARALGLDQIEYHSLDIPLSYLWVLFMLGTFAHVIYARFIVTRLVDLHYNSESERKTDSVARGQQVFDEIRTLDTLVLQGLMPRTEPTRPGSRIIKMSPKDLTTWVSLGLALVTVVALLPWRWDHGLHFASIGVSLAYGAIAAIIVGLNWWAGGYWIIRVSHFKDNDVLDSLRKPFYDSLSSSGLPNPLSPAQSKGTTLLLCCLVGIGVAVWIGFSVT